MMSASWFVSVLFFGVSMMGTPGPNNVMLTASGARYGYRRTLPFILGIFIGCVVLFTGVGFGLGALFQRYPLVHTSVQFAGAAYLLYLAWKIASAPPPALTARTETRPIRFWQGVVLQFANPKAWIMGITLMASFLPRHGWLPLNILGLALCVALMAFPCNSFWAVFGKAMGHWLTTPRAWRIFNGVMGALTAACVGFIFLD